MMTRNSKTKMMKATMVLEMGNRVREIGGFKLFVNAYMLTCKILKRSW